MNIVASAPRLTNKQEKKYPATHKSDDAPGAEGPVGGLGALAAADESAGADALAGLGLGVDVGGAGASTLRGWGAALGAPPPSMAEIMSPNGFACCARGGGIAK